MKYFLSFFLIIFTGVLLAQNLNTPKENTGSMKTNSLYVSGTLEGEFWFFYERIFKSLNAFEIGYGIKGGNSQENRLSNQTDQSQFYSGNIFMGTFKRYFSTTKHPYYLSILFFYKNFSFDHGNILHIEDGTSTCQVRGSNKEVYGLKFLVGRKLNFEIKNRFSLIIDIYAGVGLREKFFNDIIYEEGSSNANNTCICTPYPQPISDNSILTVPSIHTGVRVGFGF